MVVRALYWLFSLSTFSILAIIALLTNFSFSPLLASAESITTQNDGGLIMTDRNNQPFFTFFDAKNKEVLSLGNISPYVKMALIATEDKDFYNHQGFSVKSIFRSLKDNLELGEPAFGGSTITQQLVKNTLLNPQKNIIRKFQELLLAQNIEQKYSKDEILSMYLNSIYFGEGAFGIGKASKIYFDKPAMELNLAESAMLIGILPAPSQLSPISGNFEAAKIKQSEVLQKMLEQNMITEEEKRQAEELSLSFNHQRESINDIAPHFALMVLDQLIDKYGLAAVQNGGFTVKTTLDPDKQVMAEKVIQKHLQQLAKNKAQNGAAVIMDPNNGEILALVGSIDWYDNRFGKLNMATAPRQPGSSFKPLVYAQAIDQGLITPATILKDSPTTFEGGYKPRDFDGRFRGNVTTRKALANSLNIPSVEIMTKVGLVPAIETAKKMGITSLKNTSDYGLSLVLGAGAVPLHEMTTAYAVLANEGVYHPATSILEIKDKQNQLIFQNQTESYRVFQPSTAYLISSILSDQSARSEIFGNSLNTNRPAAVKTGTTDNFKDALTLGYTPSLVIGVWVGNPDNSSMDNIAGSLGAAPIWKELLETSLKGKPVEQFTPPSGSVVKATCSSVRKVKVKEKDAEGKEKEVEKQVTSSFSEYFAKGTEPRNCRVSSQF